MQVLQEKAYRRTTATILPRLDYAALAKGFGVEYMEIDCDKDLDGGVRAALEQPGPVLTRVVTDYGKRPIRWLDAVRSRYIDELTREQKVRFLWRLGSRRWNCIRTAIDRLARLRNSRHGPNHPLLDRLPGLPPPACPATTACPRSTASWTANRRRRAATGARDATPGWRWSRRR